jgi:hypothetical protein
MRSHNGTVEQDLLHIWIIGEMLMHISPHLMLTPTRKAFVDRIPVPLVFRKQAPLRAAAQDPQNSFNELPTFCFLSCISSGVLL